MRTFAGITASPVGSTLGERARLCVASSTEARPW